MFARFGFRFQGHQLLPQYRHTQNVFRGGSREPDIAVTLLEYHSRGLLLGFRSMAERGQTDMPNESNEWDTKLTHNGP